MNLFLMILPMSITASLVALAVMVGRLCLRRVPKLFSYILWSAVAVRLLIPVSFSSDFSLLRLVQTQDAGGGYIGRVATLMEVQKNPVVDAGIREISRLVNSALPAIAAPATSTSPLQLILTIGSAIWITGVAGLLIRSIVSYLHLVSRLRTATLVQDNVYETDQIDTPFVCGFWKPKIYIPTGMSENERSYIVLHEQTHIRRRDYLIKPFAFLLVILHWFNPLMWLSYSLMSKDMEMSCDERVVNKMGDRIKVSYSASLLNMSTGRSGALTGSPLAFGENDVKARIKHIITYRKPSSWRMAAYTLVIAVLVVGCTANPKQPPMSSSLQRVAQPHYSGYSLEQLLANKTLYVGSASKVGGLIGGMPKPAGLIADGLELHTKAQPYGVTVHYVRNDPTGISEEGAVNGETFYRNSILMLSLIDNVDWITYSIADQAGRYDGAVYSITFTRGQIEEQIGEDVRRHAADEVGLKRLIDRLPNAKSESVVPL
ncbi:M56 family metallopeptidase [Paenibacillus oceani]|uniref:DUF4825 domain-containing protein n=1 Tax=Paenibacillus oceani TaxID=2772510 RepID=A0A927CAU6_9BACL|nr:M56 family metallopeptidase [Paenibacillus oceani]MBD2864628.1 DUF4825 domain-containing protein [Paenibacillus oceani]